MQPKPSKDLAAFRAKMYCGQKKGNFINKTILVDSCASISIASEEFFKAMKKSRSEMKIYSGPPIKVGDGTRQVVLGECTFYFFIGDKKFSINTVIIRNWQYDILVSVKWLRVKHSK